jgi:hypothetical protein
MERSGAKCHFAGVYLFKLARVQNVHVAYFEEHNIYNVQEFNDSRANVLRANGQGVNIRRADVQGAIGQRVKVDRATV